MSNRPARRSAYRSAHLARGRAAPSFGHVVSGLGVGLFSQAYWEAVRHPWPCWLFVVPLLAAYELGVLASGVPTPDLLRNGADCWLRSTLAEFGLPALYGAPLLVTGVLLAWCLARRADRPRRDYGTLLIGMTIESAAFALGLYTVSRGVFPLLQTLGIPLQSMGSTLHPNVAQVLSFLGAGLYEETLFRLLLFSGLLAVFRWAELREGLAVVLATLISALLFSAAHHWGPCGEPYQTGVFLFRTVAGAYFAGLFQWRGFGVAVGAHTGYDVLVGIFLAQAF